MLFEFASIERPVSAQRLLAHLSHSDLSHAPAGGWDAVLYVIQHEKWCTVRSDIRCVPLTRVGCNAIVEYVNADCITFTYASWLLRDLSDQSEDTGFDDGPDLFLISPCV